MQLYDMKSDVDWFYDGNLTAQDMRNTEEYSKLFSEPCVLFDNGAGKVYGFETLKETAARYAVPYTAVSETFANVIAASIGLYIAPGVSGVSDLADSTAEAVAELGVVAANAQKSAEDTAQAVAELGVIVAGLSA